MTDEVYVVTDLGPGDGGKGGVVQFLAGELGAKTIVKEGGAQGSHGVVTAAGESFNFSQWGCGTLDGIPTFISERFIISPTGMLKEADALTHQGIHHPFELLVVDPNALIATPYHQAWSQIDELRRRDHPRGTVGTGVGKAYRQAEANPNLAIYAKDLVRGDRNELTQKLKVVRDEIREQTKEWTEEQMLEDDRECFSGNQKILTDEHDYVLNDVVDKFIAVGRMIQLAELADILEKPGPIIVEKSHGVLTDAERGLKPHVSAIRTLPKFTSVMFKQAGYRGKIHHVGVHRAYEIRHGAGPMPSYDPRMSELLPGSAKEANRFQGEVRAGPLDLVLLRYALECISETPLDYLCITWFDQVLKNGYWSLCTDYQTVLTRLLVEKYISEVKGYHRRNIGVDAEKLIGNPEKMLDFVAKTMAEYVKVPVRLVSYGASELEKILR